MTRIIKDGQLRLQFHVTVLRQSQLRVLKIIPFSSETKRNLTFLRPLGTTARGSRLSYRLKPAGG